MFKPVTEKGMEEQQFVALAMSLGIHVEVVRCTDRLTNLLSEPVNRLFALLVPEISGAAQHWVALRRPWTVSDHFCHNGLQLAIGIFVIHCACARCHRLRTVGLKECTGTYRPRPL